MNIDLTNLLKTLGRKESEICEFKVNNTRPELIGASLSALSNSATVLRVDTAYLFFGINDQGQVVGTKFNPDKKYKNQELKNWLATQLKPAVDFQIQTIQSGNKKVVVFTVAAASLYPVKFKKQAGIRVGSYSKSLVDHPNLEKTLWHNLSQQTFETTVALENLNQKELLEKLDCEKYFEFKKVVANQPLEKIIQLLEADQCIRQSGGGYAITNLGALLMAKDMNDFQQLCRKVPRLIIYRGRDRINAVKDITVSAGYILCIPQILEYIFTILPHNEEIRGAFRVEKKLYPEEALRELIVNALIHQDLTSQGSDPMIEVFPNRIEIRNPGRPLIETNRFVDESKSRNPLLARAMRLLNFCEEKGSGIDRVLLACELYQLPPPLITTKEVGTTVTIYAPQKLTRMNKADKIRACYLHACLKFVSDGYMTNQSLRERLGISQSNYPTASKIIKETLEAGLIVIDSSNHAGRAKNYLPYWARPSNIN